MTVKNFKNYYQILGISQDASSEEIRKAYYRLARKYHPDLNLDNKYAETRLKEINEAQEVLSDAKKRQQHDFYLESEQGKRLHSQSNNLNFASYDSWSNLINNFLSHLGLTKGYKTSKNQTFFYKGFNKLQPEDSEESLLLTLSEGFNGTQKQFSFNNEIMTAYIPPGAKTGSSLKIRGKGKVNSLSQERGDLYLNIQLIPHSLFEFEGEDLVA